MRSLLRWLHSFTLIEMLVVIAIIGILAGMLLPALAMAREQGRRTKCKSNLSQIGKGCHLYSENNGEFFPYYDSSSSTESLALLYPDILQVVDIFKCPSTDDIPEITVTKDSKGIITRRQFGAERPTWSSFGYDQEIGFRNMHPLTPLCVDMDGSSVADPNGSTSNHKGGQNILFYDGSVDWKQVNTWRHAYKGNDVDDNFYTNEAYPDTDSFFHNWNNKAEHRGDTDSFLYR